jgi:UDP-N-acetylmuramoylalanine--D-glutamate ligase
MIQIPGYVGKSVAVLGLGLSGLAAARAMMESDADVWAWDDNAGARAEAEAVGISVRDPGLANWRKMSALIMSPGIPHTHPSPHPIAKRAKDAGCPIIGDMELLMGSQPEAAYVGITGTNGKSTTTSLIAHILEKAGRTIQVGGNLGTPVLELLPMGDGGIYVLEMSSFQLDLTPSISCDFSVLLNISPDHLGRHGGMDEYVEAKKMMFRNQTADSTMFIGIDDDYSREVFKSLRADRLGRAIPISGVRALEKGVFAMDGILFDSLDGDLRPILDLADAPALPGAHNAQNAAAAYAVTRSAGLDWQEISDAVKTYPGLAHRQEHVEVIDGVAYINDSKATNADAAARALGCYEAICWIAGGQSKEGGIDPIAPYLNKVVHAFLIGEAQDAFAAVLADRVPVTKSDTLAKAVEQAHQRAQEEKSPGCVVLLSPACASFDQFDNFEQRGDVFKALVQGLPGQHGSADQHESQGGALR